MALAVLAFFGNALPLFIGLMGFYGWERHARIARGLAIAAGGQGYAASVRQLGAGPLRVYGRHVLPNIASTLIVSATLVVSGDHPAGERAVVPGPGGAAAADLARQHGRLRPRLPAAGAVDPAGAGCHDRADDAVHRRSWGIGCATGWTRRWTDRARPRSRGAVSLLAATWSPSRGSAAGIAARRGRRLARIIRLPVRRLLRQQGEHQQRHHADHGGGGRHARSKFYSACR